MADGARLYRHRPPDRLEGDWGVDVADGRVYADMRRTHEGQLSAQGSLVLRLR